VRRLFLRPRAVGDLDAIWAYSAARWGAVQAEDYLRSIRDACAALAAGGASGRDASDIGPGYRKLRVRRHVIFFRLPADNSVAIVRILHERMDASSRLRDG
jgi:toxin ParE1/3/4